MCGKTWATCSQDRHPLTEWGRTHAEVPGAPPCADVTDRFSPHGPTVWWPQTTLAAQIVGVVDDGLCDTRSHVVSELVEEVRLMPETFARSATTSASSPRWVTASPENPPPDQPSTLIPAPLRRELSPAHSPSHSLTLGVRK
jgi:hypothetical protein